jgi:predicted metallopeptidase
VSAESLCSSAMTLAAVYRRHCRTRVRAITALHCYMHSYRDSVCVLTLLRERQHRLSTCLQCINSTQHCLLHCCFTHTTAHRKYMAAVAIQCLVRCYQALVRVAAVRRLRAHTAATVLQCLCRCASARRTCARLRQQRTSAPQHGATPMQVRPDDCNSTSSH